MERMNMKTAFAGLFVIPLLIGLIGFSSVGEACEGGSYPSNNQVFLNEDITVGANNYTARVFIVNETAREVRVRGEEGVRVFVLDDAQMANFTTGKEFSTVYNSTSSSDFIQDRLVKGSKYWVIVDNRGNNAPVQLGLQVEEIGPMYMPEKCVDRPFFVPDVSSGFVAVAMVLAMAITIVLKRR